MAGSLSIWVRSTLKSLAPVAAAALAAMGQSVPHAAAAEKPVNYQDDVMPILRQYCFNCHNNDTARSDLNLTSYQSINLGGAGGEVLVSGDPGSSRLYLVITHQEEPVMPPNGQKIPDKELAVIKKWIEEGLLDKPGGAKKAINKPAVSLSMSTSATQRPEGPPPMPEKPLALEPVVLTSRANAVTAMAASPWAPLVAIAGEKQVLLYNTDTLDLVGILPFEEGLINSLRFTRDGRFLMAAGGEGAAEGKAILWNIKSGERIAEIGDEEDAILAADVSPDGSHIAVGGSDKLIKIYSVQTGKVVNSIKKHTDWIFAVEFSPDGVLLASADRSGGLHVWEASSGNEFFTLDGHKAAINTLSWRDDSNVLASGAEDGAIKMWDMHEGKQIKNWNAHSGGVLGIHIGHDGNIASAGRDSFSRLWGGDGSKKHDLGNLGDHGTKAVITHDNKRVIAGAFNGNVIVFDAENKAELGRLPANPPSIEGQRERAAARLKEIEGKLQAIGGSVTEHQKRLDEAVRQQTEMKTRIAKGKELVEKGPQQSEELKKKLSTVRGEQKNAQGKLTELKRTLNQVNKKKDGLGKALQQATAELDAANKVKETANQAIKDLSGQVAAAEKALKDAEAAAAKEQPKDAKEGEKAPEKKPENKPDTKGLADKLNKLKGDFGKATANLGAAEAKRKEAVDKVDRTKVMIAEADKELASAQGAVNEVEKKVAEFKKAEEKDAEAVRSLQNEIADSRKNLGNWQKELDARTKRVGEATAALDKVKKEQAQVASAKETAQQSLERWQKVLQTRTSASAAPVASQKS